MRNFTLFTLLVTIGGFVLTNQATTSVEGSALTEQLGARNAQLCQLDPKFCRDI